jgi:hypothetical protein
MRRDERAQSSGNEFRNLVRWSGSRFMMQLSIGYLPHKEIMKSIELYGNVVAPAVRQHVGVKEKV